MMRGILFSILAALTLQSARAAEPADLPKWLAQEIIGPQLALEEVQAYVEARVPTLPKFQNAAQWRAHADEMRKNALEQVIFRGAAEQWRNAKGQVVWEEAVISGPGYRIKKLRYEALPGLWIPALLYEPEKLTGKMPVSINLNGHEGPGKAVLNKQIRCINQAKRGIIALSPEWLNMGQLRGSDFTHYKLNQIDLCGTSGVAPFFLAMTRGLDLLLQHEHADPTRVAASGLSGGGWQTIFLSAFDTRVTLANPVAGYSSFRTRARNFSDLGDSEQTPVDLGAVTDYAQMTAMLAPRPALLTYNAADDCCFKAAHALPPLLEAAQPIYKLLGHEGNLRSHINHEPGNHNYDRDNREAFYRLLGEHFFAGSKDFDPVEINCEQEIKTGDELNVPLPEENSNLHKLAVDLMKELPRQPRDPDSRDGWLKWQQENRAKLMTVLRIDGKSLPVEATSHGTADAGGVKATTWKLRLGRSWTVPCVELTPADINGTTILVADAGRGGASEDAERLLASGQRVLAVDPYYFGESKIASHDYLFAMLLSAIGERALGLQAAQIVSIAAWARRELKAEDIRIVVVGPRLSLAALCAAAVSPEAIGGVELHGSLGSLKEIIEQNKAVNEMPELFCFGLLAEFDVRQLSALCAPRPVRFIEPSDRCRQEMAELSRIYGTFGVKFDPLP